MGTIDHGSVLGILERRARRFRPEMRLMQEDERLDARIDESGTLAMMVNDAEMMDRALDAWVVEDRELRNINDEVLEIHGVRPGKKLDGVVWLVYENVNLKTITR